MRICEGMYRLSIHPRKAVLALFGYGFRSRGNRFGELERDRTVLKANASQAPLRNFKEVMKYIWLKQVLDITSDMRNSQRVLIQPKRFRLATPTLAHHSEVQNAS
jgi:hypothetical protein